MCAHVGAYTPVSRRGEQFAGVADGAVNFFVDRRGRPRRGGRAFSHGRRIAIGATSAKSEQERQSLLFPMSINRAPRFHCRTASDKETVAIYQGAATLGGIP